jgi:hypothetical protein
MDTQAFLQVDLRAGMVILHPLGQPGTVPLPGEKPPNSARPDTRSHGRSPGQRSFRQPGHLAPEQRRIDIARDVQLLGIAFSSRIFFVINADDEMVRRVGSFCKKLVKARRPLASNGLSWRQYT